MMKIRHKIKQKIKQKMKTGALTMLLLGGIGIAAAAYADCTNPAGVEGEMTYNTTHKTMQFCDGTDWIGMGGISPAAGGGSPYLDYTDCEAKNGVASSNYQTINITCSAGYHLIDSTCAVQNSGGYCYLTQENRLTIYKYNGTYHTYGSIKCCAYVVP